MKNNNDNEYVSGRPNLMDMLFGLTLLGVIAFVSWVGYLAYQEGLKIETSKRHGEEWLQWMAEASEKRFQPGFELSACGGVQAPANTGAAVNDSAAPANAAASSTWGACFKALTQTDGPWFGQINPFSNTPIELLLKCDKSDLRVAGHFFFEKLTPTPPGSPMPSVASPFTSTDSLDQKIQLRLTLCDKGGDPIRIGEVEF